MNLEDKKLIAEWMGYNFDLAWYWKKGYNKNATKKRFESFNPDTDRNLWPEIWERIEEKLLTEKYLTNLIKNWYIKLIKNWYIKKEWYLHTAPPEICTKALLEVIKGVG